MGTIVANTWVRMPFVLLENLVIHQGYVVLVLVIGVVVVQMLVALAIPPMHVEVLRVSARSQGLDVRRQRGHAQLLKPAVGAGLPMSAAVLLLPAGL